ncbi:competence/damage-inducible protein A [Sedimentibacter sp. zth1]|uniref:competence/damage-inducible protein A n=1 Tax=Sedimentibacter sp. zth1 TaxID=2816908 RepID=UPI001A9142D7|nr:competence/damage-inducible protein A [Sedimentibacter sp. zth1]QSX05268.1 competence/damage-inducible protein A [Sedimentibacter sp. zth1]
MNCEVLCIGTELLHGDIVNSNAAYISKSLAHIGIDVHYQSVVGDNPTRMKEAFLLAFSRADLVICTGGLGPTKDDITKEITAEFFNLPMEFDNDSLEHVKNIFKKFNREMTENNVRQAYFPKGSIILDNKNGTANACIVNAQSNGKKNICILLPGPPKEMIPLMDTEVIPYLKRFSENIVVGKKVAVINVGESKAETMIMDLIDSQTNPTIAPYAGSGRVVFRVTAKAKSEDEALGLINPVVNELLHRFGDNAFVLSSDSVEHDICKKIVNRNVTISTAESCTGGMIASKLVSYPGISKVFKEGFVTYSREAKINILGVNKSTIDKYTEVSEEVAKEMAFNVTKISNADIGIATTGIAGPTGGTDDKPVGLVYLCVYYNNQYFVTKKVYFGARDTVREQASLHALEMVRKII